MRANISPVAIYWFRLPREKKSLVLCSRWSVFYAARGQALRVHKVKQKKGFSLTRHSKVMLSSSILSMISPWYFGPFYMRWANPGQPSLPRCRQIENLSRNNDACVHGIFPSRLAEISARYRLKMPRSRQSSVHRDENSLIRRYSWLNFPYKQYKNSCLARFIGLSRLHINTK